MTKALLFVISLPTATARRDRFIARAKLGDVSVEIVDAHTEPSSDLLYNPKDALKAKGRLLQPAELGVYSSHFSIWQRMIRDNIDKAFIFEDDAVVDWALLPDIEALTARFPKMHYVRLFAKRPCKMRVLTEQLSAGRCLVDYRGYAYGAQAYFITKYAAEVFSRHCRNVRMAVDDQMDRSWEHGLPNLAIFPFPSFEENVRSTIGPDRFVMELISPWSPARLQFRVADKLSRLRQRVTGFGRIDRIEALR